MQHTIAFLFLPTVQKWDCTSNSKAGSKATTFLSADIIAKMNVSLAELLKQHSERPHVIIESSDFRDSTNS